MTAPGNSPLIFALLAAFVACTGYAAGRLHQWHRTLQDRDEAYRDGYDTATRSVFSMAARIMSPRREKAAIRASASVITSTCRPSTEPAKTGKRGGRHLVPDELVEAETYRLPPDRVARAKVRDEEPGEVDDEATTRLHSVPRPRSS
ncbi:hypothetical protein [Mangrovihabitans endophyticus]|nr:hypothetical protein [Mangrovihabitans endophyticus]